jgi:uncharacterized oligopeptide transporter (OPT) family protein
LKTPDERIAQAIHALVIGIVLNAIIGMGNFYVGLEQGRQASILANVISEKLVPKIDKLADNIDKATD